MMAKLNGEWNANWKEFVQDKGKKYNWVYLVDSFGYTKFDKDLDIITEFTNIPHKKAILYGYKNSEIDIIIIGEEYDYIDDIVRYTIVNDGVVMIGIHPSTIKVV